MAVRGAENFWSRRVSILFKQTIPIILCCLDSLNSFTITEKFKYIITEKPDQFTSLVINKWLPNKPIKINVQLPSLHLCISQVKSHSKLEITEILWFHIDREKTINIHKTYQKSHYLQPLTIWNVMCDILCYWPPRGRIMTL